MVAKTHEGRYMRARWIPFTVQYLPMAACRDNDDTTLGKMIGKLDIEIFSKLSMKIYLRW